MRTPGSTFFDSGDVEASYALDVDFILGHLYTTSYCSRELLGDRVSQFEKDIRRELYRVDTGGTYRWSPGANYIFARKRD